MKRKSIIIGMAILFIIVFAARYFLKPQSQAQARTEPSKIIEEHMKIYRERLDNDRAEGEFLAGEEYQNIMDRLDEFGTTDAQLTELLIGKQNALRKDCFYWDSEAIEFYKVYDCNEGGATTYEDYYDF